MQQQRLLLALLLWASLFSAWIGAVLGPATGPRGPVPDDPAPSAEAQELPPGWPSSLQAQVDPPLLKQALQDRSAPLRFVVEMADQADLTQRPAGLNRVEQRAWVVDVLQATAQASQADIRAELQARQARGQVLSFRPFWIVNGLSVVADADTLLALADRSDVARLRQDRWLQRIPSANWQAPGQGTADSAEWNITRIGAPLAWSALDLDGTGIVIAVVDTGVDAQHPLLQSRYRGYNPHGPAIHAGNWICTTDEDYQYPGDGHGHGTHVTGTALGGQDEGDVAVGVAPGARWIAAKALSNGGYAYDSWLHAAFEWILAPAGDPSLAPDIVNNSWGSSLSDNEVLRPDLQALRAAGIVPVFSAGNEGPGARTVSSPASLPEALAVGATDDADTVATFSGRGPSPWGETKPEVVAPGAPIRSSLPGGAYGQAYGTSMAAPHVSGAVALMLQADPSLSLSEVEAILTATARPIGTPVPNNDAGWGRIDAYQAAAVALQAGYLAGQVTRAVDGEPVATAQVSALDHDGHERGRVNTDPDGRYELALQPGLYDVSVEAFGFESALAYGVSISTNVTTPLSFSVALLPTGVVWGQVVNAETGGPVGAQIAALGTPASTTSDRDTGTYSLPLPGGEYSIEVRQNGFRVETVESVQVVASTSTRVDVGLLPAPQLLLVDSGTWYYGSQIAYLEGALDDGAFAYDRWQIRNLAADVPTEEDLAPFDVVVWSAPQDAPGLIGAGDTISTYLSTGGDLILTGQDVGYWDGGLSGRTWSAYYAYMLKSRAIADIAGGGPLVGTAGDLLDGLSLPLNGPDSAQNQGWPDAIALLDPQAGAILGRYADDGDAALRVGTCLPYQAAYLAAGLEGLGDQASRAETLERLITWLDAPPEPVGVDAWPAEQAQVWLRTGPITYTLSLRNTGQATDPLSLSLSPAAWPTSLWTGDFGAPLTPPVTLEPCEALTIGVRVDVPPEVGWNATDVVTLTAHSLTDPTQVAQATFHSKTPAPVLLVDDHRWYDMLGSYQAALEAHHLPYDVWRVQELRQSPTQARLQSHPVVIWFTAYDWYKTLTPDDEARLAGYLDNGGRLLLSSQDYLYTSRSPDFARETLGVLGYTEGVTATQVTGAVGSPIGHTSGTLELDYPFRNWSDALRPHPAAATAFWGQHGQPVALTLDAAPFKTAFFAFPLETLSPDAMAAVVGQTVGWLSPLGDSSLAVDRRVAVAGEPLRYTLVMRNTGPAPLSGVVLSNTVPAFTTYVPGSLQGPAAYDPATQRFIWTGTLTPGQAIDVRYRVQVDGTAPQGTVVQNVAHLGDESGLHLTRSARSRVDTPDLSPSTKVASVPVAMPRQALAYTLRLTNAGLQAAQARLTDPMPPYSLYVPGSAWASAGVLTPTAEALGWAGSIGPGQAVTLTFQAWISPSATGLYVLNRAHLDDGWGDLRPLEVATWVEGRLFLPLVFKGR
jgi:uncharacterized repeat protein (TIGR01451 family)